MGENTSAMTKLYVNGEIHDIVSNPETPLVYVLRNELGLMGTKLGCGLEQCGACAVLADGEVALSCVREVGTFEGIEVVTIEGVRALPVGRKVQQAFVDAAAAQCGYCTPGLVVAVTALLSGSERPSDDDVRGALSPHLCRCGSHASVLRAVDSAIASLWS